MYTVKVSYQVRKQAEIQVSGVDSVADAEESALDIMDDIPSEYWSEEAPYNLDAQVINKD